MEGTVEKNPLRVRLQATRFSTGEPESAYKVYKKTDMWECENLASSSVEQTNRTQITLHELKENPMGGLNSVQTGS